MVDELPSVGGLTGLWEVFVCLIYSGACLGLGWRLSAIASNKTTSGLAHDLLSGFLLGVLGLGALIIGMALLGVLHSTVLWTVILACYGLSLPLWKSVMGCSRCGNEIAAYWQGITPPERLLSLAALGVTFSYLLAALITPPIGDAEAFYLNYAQIIAATGELQPMPGAFAFFSTISLPGELHFAALISLAGQGAAKCFIFPIAGAIAAFLVRICMICGGGRSALLITLITLLSSSTFTHYAIDGKVDLIAPAFGLAAVYWALRATQTQTPALALMWTGLMTGAATMAKFSYLPSLLPALLLILIWRNFDGRYATYALATHRTVREALSTAVWAILPWLPHFLKNAALFGAPFAPFIGGPEDTGWLNQVWFSPETTRWILATYPFALVFGRYPMQGGGLSFVLLAFVPFVWLMWRQITTPKNLLWRVTLAGLLGLAIWMVLRPSVIAPRYFLASALLLLPIVAISTEHILQPAQGHALLRRGVIAVLWAALLSSMWHTIPALRATPAYISGTLDPCALASDYCVPLRTLALEDPRGPRIFLAGYYSYWLRPDQIFCLDTPAEAMHVLQDPDPVAQLQALGFGRLVVDATSHGWLLDAVRHDDRAEFFAQNASVYVYGIAPGAGGHATCDGTTSQS